MAMKKQNMYQELIKTGISKYFQPIDHIAGSVLYFGTTHVTVTTESNLLF